MHSAYMCVCNYTSPPTRARKRDVLRAYIKHPDKDKHWMKLSTFWIRNK